MLTASAPPAWAAAFWSVPLLHCSPGCPHRWSPMNPGLALLNHYVRRCKSFASSRGKATPANARPASRSQGEPGQARAATGASVPCRHSRPLDASVRWVLTTVRRRRSRSTCPCEPRRRSSRRAPPRHPRTAMFGSPSAPAPAPTPTRTRLLGSHGTPRMWQAGCNHQQGKTRSRVAISVDSTDEWKFWQSSKSQSRWGRHQAPRPTQTAGSPSAAGGGPSAGARPFRSSS